MEKPPKVISPEGDRLKERLEEAIENFYDTGVRLSSLVAGFGRFKREQPNYGPIDEWLTIAAEADFSKVAEQVSSPEQYDDSVEYKSLIGHHVSHAAMITNE